MIENLVPVNSNSALAPWAFVHMPVFETNCVPDSLFQLPVVFICSLSIVSIPSGTGLGVSNGFAALYRPTSESCGMVLSCVVTSILT